LSDEFKRRTYDDVFFGQITPLRAHSIFDDFFGSRHFEFPAEDDFLKPIIDRSWRKKLDNMMDIEEDLGNVKEGETVKTSSVYTNKNGVETKKNVTTKKAMKDGKVVEEKTEDYLLPNGVREVIKTIKDGDKISKKKYELKKG
jgi:hypothetical protein